MFGQTVKFGQRSGLFHTSIINIKNNEANSEDPDETAHMEPSYLDFHCLQMSVRTYLMSEFTRLYPTCTRKAQTNMDL